MILTDEQLEKLNDSESFITIGWTGSEPLLVAWDSNVPLNELVQVLQEAMDVIADELSPPEVMH